MRNVVRAAYPGSRQGSRLTSIAPGVVIETSVPWATWPSPISAAKTQRIASTSHAFGNRRLAAMDGKRVADITVPGERYQRLFARVPIACHARNRCHFD